MEQYITQTREDLSGFTRLSNDGIVHGLTRIFLHLPSQRSSFLFFVDRGQTASSAFLVFHRSAMSRPRFGGRTAARERVPVLLDLPEDAHAALGIQPYWAGARSSVWRSFG
jgi:hypothetical protein